MKRIRYAAFFLSCTFAWGLTPFVSHAATSVVISQNTTFAAGEYFFDSLTITSSSTLTLLGNPAATSFKGVIIHAENLTVDSGSRISADGAGYGRGTGPGAPSYYRHGASYGGVGEGNAATSTYGSAMYPTELGSGSYGPGGGAIQLLVSKTLTNNGAITAYGKGSGSGGSIYAEAGTLSGAGAFTAIGSNLTNAGGYYVASGGGGRVMIRYAASSFTGKVDVSGGCGSSGFIQTCAGSGTAGLLDTTTNTLLLPQAWRFQANDSPFSFASIIVTKGSAASEPGVRISADQLALSAQSSVAIGTGVHLEMSRISLDGASVLSFLGAAETALGDVTISGGSKVTTALGQALNLSLANLTVSSGSSVEVSAKGYAAMKGPGAPAGSSSGMGASYGGKGYANTATSTYGDANNPTDLGSGGTGAGGGALALTLSGRFTNNGVVAADGQWSGSGGSILVHAREIVGSGTFSANGAGKTTSSYLGPGGGGRIALYTDTAPSFGGKVEAKGACNSNFGYFMYCGDNGTIVIKDTGPKVSNVLFLPGIEASRLYRPGDLLGTDQLWEPNTDNDGSDLLLTAEGESVRNDIYTRDVVDEAYVSGVGMNIYTSFINQMNGLKAEKVIADWEAVPYDWRLSFDDILSNGNQLPDGRIYYAGSAAATSSPYIIQELRRLAASSKTGKVTIVAHSNGGLLTKALTEKLGDTEAAKLIDKIIFVAVPQAGTPQAVGALLHGYEQGLPRDWLSLFLTPETARTLALNMPSVYNLLPSANYFTYVDDPAVTFDDSDILSEFRSRYGSSIHDGALLKSFVTDTSRTASSSPSDLKYPSVGNGALYSLAETLHSTIDTWAPPQGVKLYEVAGWGEDTLATIEYKEGKKAYCGNMSDLRTCTVSPTIVYSPKEVVEGDGTVLVPSALWSPASTGVQKYWVNLRKYNNDFPRSMSHFDNKHADILEVVELRTLVQNILTNSTSTLPRFITTEQPVAAGGDTRLRFLLHSPLDLSATDSLGNTVSSATSTIPGARWRRYGEVQVLTVPENTPITLNLDGYDAGSFTLDIEEVDGSNVVVASSTLSAIPSTEDTRASMVFTDGTLQGASPLLLDYDGNGTTDISIKSKIGKEVVFDTTPPEAVVTFDPVSQQIVVVGSDNLSSTTVVTTATSSLITDEAGNTLEILFKKFKKEGKESKVEIQGLRYNGVLVGEVSKTVLQYEWSVDKTGKLKELQEKASVGPLTVEGHYDAKKNITRIEREKGEEDKKERKENLPGLAIIGLKTDKGVVNITY